MNRGYIKLWRCSEDDPMYLAEKFTRWQAWQDLIMLANHKDGEILVRGNVVRIKRGEVAAAEEFLAKRWGWSRGRVRRFMDYLQSPSVLKVEQQKSNIITKYTILNYDRYQRAGTTNEQQTDGRQYTPNNDKNEKKEKRESLTRGLS